MFRIYCLLIGYVFGLFQTSFILGKLKGIDIRDYGSGNAGTTNTARTLGKKAGITVMLLDITKCILAVKVSEFLFAGSYPELLYLIRIYAGAGAILGHDFPFYLGFKGGKGIAATGGLVISFHWLFFAVGVFLFFGPVIITRYVSLGSIILYIGFFILMIICGETGYLFGEMPAGARVELYIISFLLMALALWLHRENIGRLIRGNERKLSLGSGSLEKREKNDKKRE